MNEAKQLIKMAKVIIGYDDESHVIDVFMDEVVDKVKKLRFVKDVHIEDMSAGVDGPDWYLEGGVSFELDVRRGNPSPRNMAKMLKQIEKIFKDWERPELKISISPSSGEMSLREYAKTDANDLEDLSIYVECEVGGSDGFDGGAYGDMKHDQLFDK